ncbi:ABC-type transport system periplasmic substrate-binding protein [Haloferax gibbonsii]|uniref:ABC-type transport system periplasmic substrate-binding protein n=1 Tax=Haloferax gibbonsii TaxID=35746 RepID=A0A871BHZ0_HALGI|nr:ABC transporter substrate-binding protein [Haloferax gibbonsii]QOS12701.1 ABC-type transport system periplasmic substrate-binding protein [Haloferax gibbonsii]
MSDTHDALTRRDYLTYGSAAVTAALAGCSGQASEATTTQTQPDATTTSTPDDERYTATLAPAGRVSFTDPPENVFTVLLHHADMVVALGHGEALNGMYNPEGFGQIYDLLLERLPGVSVDWSVLADTWNPDKEVLYELDSDLHLEDPALMATMEAWDSDDVEEVRTAIAPWFGNSLSRNHSEPPAAWVDQYQYYTLWEIFEQVATVFHAQDQYEALADIRRDLLNTIAAGLEETDQRPSVARFLWRGGIWVYPLNGPGTVRAHTRVFDAEDALADVPSGTQIDMEALVEADPDVILVDGGLGPNWEATKQELYDEPTAQGLSAVANDRVFPIGVRYGGPLMNLFQLEMIAKQLYPEQFGAWPTYEGGPYPDIADAQQLFDRQRVADSINGNV